MTRVRGLLAVSLLTLALIRCVFLQALGIGGRKTLACEGQADAVRTFGVVLQALRALARDPTPLSLCPRMLQPWHPTDVSMTPQALHVFLWKVNAKDGAFAPKGNRRRFDYWRVNIKELLSDAVAGGMLLTAYDQAELRLGVSSTPEWWKHVETSVGFIPDNMAPPTPPLAFGAPPGSVAPPRFAAAAAAAAAG